MSLCCVNWKRYCMSLAKVICEGIMTFACSIWNSCFISSSLTIVNGWHLLMTHLTSPKWKPSHVYVLPLMNWDLARFTWPPPGSQRCRCLWRLDVELSISCHMIFLEGWLLFILVRAANEINKRKLTVCASPPCCTPSCQMSRGLFVWDGNVGTLQTTRASSSEL